MTYLGKDAILGADDLSHEDVDVPEWGGTVRIRALSGSERDRWEAAFLGKDGKPSVDKGMANVRARLVIACAVDESDNQLFSHTDEKALGRKNAAALDRLFDAAQRLSGLSDEDVEELAGN